MAAESLLIWITGLLAGSMIFFGVTVAPTVFRALPADHAGRYLRAFFPHYYLWGFAVAAAAVIVALGLDWRITLVLALVAGLFVYSRQVLMPQINRSRDAELAGEAGAGERFHRQHRLSVVINMFQLVLLVGISAYLVWW